MYQNTVKEKTMSEVYWCLRIMQTSAIDNKIIEWAGQEGEKTKRVFKLTIRITQENLA